MKDPINIRSILNKGIVAEEAQRKIDHDQKERTHKLSASSLGMPVQWQILKYLGVQRKSDDEFDLLKFRRGRDVEDFLVGMIQAHGGMEIQTQFECHYRDCIGYLDLLIKTENGWHPVEIKSTNNLAYKHLLKEGNAKKNHALQAAFYAVALGYESFTVCYINSDTYQTISFTYKTNDFKAEIDSIIDNFLYFVEEKRIPEFKPTEKWMANEQYQQYPEFANMELGELYKKAKELYGTKA